MLGGSNIPRVAGGVSSFYLAGVLLHLIKSLNETREVGTKLDSRIHAETVTGFIT